MNLVPVKSKIETTQPKEVYVSVTQSPYSITDTQCCSAYTRSSSVQPDCFTECTFLSGERVPQNGSCSNVLLSVMVGVTRVIMCP